MAILSSALVVRPTGASLLLLTTRVITRCAYRLTIPPPGLVLRHTSVFTSILLSVRQNPTRIMIVHTFPCSRAGSGIGRCASLQLHTIYMFQVHYTVTFCGNCVICRLPRS